MGDGMTDLTRRHILAGGAMAVLALAMPGAVMAASFVSRRIGVTVRGSGRDVILIPGLGSAAGIWNGAVAAVPGYRYHLVQVRGFAGTAAEDNASGPVAAPVAEEIARYIASMGLRSPALVGHSIGGIIAMRIAIGHPALVGRLMVVDMLPAGAGMVGGTSGEMGPIAQRLADYFATPSGRAVFGDLMRHFSPGAGDNDPDVIAHSLKELADTDLTSRLAALRVPMTVLYAVPDDVQVRAAIARRYAAAYAGAPMARLIPVGPSGHVIMEDQPRLFANALGDFLKA